MIKYEIGVTYMGRSYFGSDDFSIHSYQELKLCDDGKFLITTGKYKGLKVQRGLAGNDLMWCSTNHSRETLHNVQAGYLLIND